MSQDPGGADETAFAAWVDWIIDSEDNHAYRSIDDAYHATARPGGTTMDSDSMVERYPDGSIVQMSWYEKLRLVLATAAEQKAFHEYLERRFTRRAGSGTTAWDAWWRTEHDVLGRYIDSLQPSPRDDETLH